MPTILTPKAQRSGRSFAIIVAAVVLGALCARLIDQEYHPQLLNMAILLDLLVVGSMLFLLQRISRSRSVWKP